MYRATRSVVTKYVEEIMGQPNEAQRRQNAGDFDLTIKGQEDWRAFLGQSVLTVAPWLASQIPEEKNSAFLPALEENARINSDSVERMIICSLLTMGYTLEELEVDMVGHSDRETWGRCVWYPEHPKYDEPLPDMFAGMNLDPRFFNAMFLTEHAGDQRVCLYSTQMSRVGWTLLHKTLLYRKVVFSPPQASKDRAAA